MSSGEQKFHLKELYSTESSFPNKKTNIQKIADSQQRMSVLKPLLQLSQKEDMPNHHVKEATLFILPLGSHLFLLPKLLHHDHACYQLAVSQTSRHSVELPESD